MTFIFVIKSLTPHDFNLSTLIFIENITFKITKAVEFSLSLIISSTTSFFIYRVVLSLSFAYKLYKKLYLIIADLYMRYTLLNKLRYITIIRIINVLFIMFIQNLYKRFDKKK